MKKPTVTIGIPAYNAEANIGRMLAALTKQQCKRVAITHIVVLSDASEDKTIQKAEQIKNSKINIHSNATRQGFAYGVKTILTSNDSDIVVMLNDDIVIKDNFMIEKLCAPILTNSYVGLVGGNVDSLPSHNFIQKTAEISHMLFKRMAFAMPTKHNKLTCDGKILAVSRNFYSKLTYPKFLGDMGNVDSYLYFSCLKNGFLYRFAEKATVYFKHVDTLPDFIKFAIRNRNSSRTMNREFKRLAEKEYRTSKRLFAYVRMSEVFLFLPYLVTLFGIHYAVEFITRIKKSHFSQIWSTVESTKKLQKI